MTLVVDGNSSSVAVLLDATILEADAVTLAEVVVVEVAVAVVTLVVVAGVAEMTLVEVVDAEMTLVEIAIGEEGLAAAEAEAEVVAVVVFQVWMSLGENDLEGQGQSVMNSDARGEMTKWKTTLVAIGGSEVAEAAAVVTKEGEAMVKNDTKSLYFGVIAM